MSLCSEKLLPADNNITDLWESDRVRKIGREGEGGTIVESENTIYTLLYVSI